MVCCAAYGCSSVSGRDKVGFFSFPKLASVKNVWVQRLGRSDSTGRAFVPGQYSKLCSKHFEEDAFERVDSLLSKIGLTTVKFRRRLKPEAVPTIFLNKQHEKKCRPSATSISQKRRRLDMTLFNTEEHFIETTPIELTTTTSTVDLNTLATVAANHAKLPCPETSQFSVQSQTPKWATFAKETQTTSNYVDSGTQTDWANDVGYDTIHLPSKPESSPMCESFMTDISASSFRDDTRDLTWGPDSDLSYDEQDDQEEDENVVSSTVRKFIVYEDKLDDLLGVCELCGKRVPVYKKVQGAQLNCTWNCTTCDVSRSWCSQSNSGTLSLGHLELCAAIMFSGCSAQRFLRALQFAGIQTFCSSVYFRVQELYLTPTIRHVWESHQAQVVHDLMETGREVRLGGDARCCSPGHTAMFGSYSMMDLTTGRILDIQLVQSNEVKNSYHMELEGLKRSLHFLTVANNIRVTHLVTDRHCAVKKYMKDERPDITHWFDVWHVAKGIYKKLEAAGKKKGCEKVQAWSHSVSNHLYWCAASSNGDGELVQQKWLSIVNHVSNVHEGHGSRFPRCEHGQISNRKWMKIGYKPHAELKKVVENKVLLKDVKKLSPAEQTSSLESFHKVICDFVPKSTHYKHANMEARLFLAALHFNENCNRQQRVTKDGKLQYSVSYPKGRKGEAVAKEVKVPQTFDYVKDLMHEVMLLRETRPSYRSAKELLSTTDKKRPLPLSQSTPRRAQRRSKQDVVDACISRFNC